MGTAQPFSQPPTPYTTVAAVRLPKLILERASGILDAVQVARLVAPTQAGQPGRRDIGIVEVGVTHIGAMKIGPAVSLPLSCALETGVAQGGEFEHGTGQVGMLKACAPSSLADRRTPRINPIDWLRMSADRSARSRRAPRRLARDRSAASRAPERLTPSSLAPISWVAKQARAACLHR